MNILETIKSAFCSEKVVRYPSIQVVIDAGHGGKDWGLNVDSKPNAGYNGILEKDINLEVASRVAWFCNRHGVGYTMTRWGDRFIELKQRCERANLTKAKLFLSLHCNYAGDSSAKGIETWHYTGSLASRVFATKIQGKLAGLNYTRDRGIKDNISFYVLKHTRMPAVIVELGFLSNPGDAMYLDNEENQFQIAEKLWEVIKEVV